MPIEPDSRRIERRSIDYVPDAERHGRVADQGPFWFLGNFHFFTIAIGFVGPGMGLSLGYTALAGTIGILFGTLFMAFHASQGAELGLPQMIQSRAQFGYRGVVLVLIGTLLTFVGFNIVDTVLVATGLHGIFGWDPLAVTLTMAAASATLAIYGYDWMHRIFRWCFFVSLPLYALLSLAIIFGFVGAGAAAPAKFTWVAFVAQTAAGASYNITFAPNVSDYSRYLPRDTARRAIISSVFLGASTSAIWLIALGAWLATRLGTTDGLVGLYSAGNRVLPGFGALAALTSVAALVATMGLNTYSAMLTAVTAIDSAYAVHPTRRLRVITICALTLLSIPLAFVSMRGSVIELLSAFLTTMLYLLVPWTAVNLVDYFFVRRGRYAILDLFNPDGIYGSWGVRGLAAYAAGFIATLPFLVLPNVYVGPIARALGGVDIGWLTGLLIAGTSYWLLCRSLDTGAEEAAIRASRAQLRIGR